MNFNLTADRTQATKSIRDALGGNTATREEGAAALLSKSENFAVSLRKTKRKQILNDKRGRFMMGQQRSRQPHQDQRELDNSPIAIATREFVGAVSGKAP